MKYQKIEVCDFVNGEGCRLTLFVSGCEHRCKGCYNESTWDCDDGIEFTDETIDYIVTELDFHDGLSLSGGDPMHPSNREHIVELCKEVRRVWGDEKDIWMWTGYKYRHIKDHEIFNHIDVVIDGKYRHDLPTTKPFRGSDNQELIYINKKSS